MKRDNIRPGAFILLGFLLALPGLVVLAFAFYSFVRAVITTVISGQSYPSVEVDGMKIVGGLVLLEFAVYAWYQIYSILNFLEEPPPPPPSARIPVLVCPSQGALPGERVVLVLGK